MGGLNLPGVPGTPVPTEKSPAPRRSRKAAGLPRQNTHISMNSATRPSTLGVHTATTSVVSE